MRLRFLATLLLFFPFSSTLAKQLEGTALLYRAVKVARGPTSETVLLPEPFRGYDPSRPEESIMRAFDALKEANPSLYGKAQLLLDPTPGGPLRATLNLDPSVPEGHQVVAAEVFHTLRGLGVTEVRAPSLRDAPLDLSAFDIPVYLQAVPFHQALPPRRLAHAVIILSPLETIPSDLFYLKLDRGDSDIVEKVLSGLVRGDQKTRLAVLAALPNLKVPNRTARLLPLLDDPSPAVRLATLKLLEADGSAAVTERLERLVQSDPDRAVKGAAARILSARGLKQYDIVVEIDRLSDPSDQVVLSALSRIAEARFSGAAQAVYDCLHHINPEVRTRALETLVALHAFPFLAKALQDQHVDASTRERCAVEVERNGLGPEREQALAYLAEQGSEALALDAIKKIAREKPQGGLATLYKALLRPEQAVREAAIEAVAAYGDPSSIPALLGAIRSDKDRVLVEAAAVKVLSKQPQEVLLERMGDQDPTVRRLAMKAFGDALQDSKPPQKAISILKSRLSDPDPAIRKAAVYALARVPDPDIADSIMALHKDPDPEVRAAAVLAASRSNSPQANDIIVSALSDEQDSVKALALKVLEERKVPQALESLKLLCSHGNEEIRLSAVKGYLALLSPAEAANDLDFLTRLLYINDPRIKVLVLETVKKVHDRRAIIAMSSLVIDPDKGVKKAAVEALASTGEKDALEGIEKAVFDTDREIRLMAIDALVTLGRKEAIDFLMEVIKMEQDAEVKARAERAMQELMAR